jgi:hypothetical protein
VNKISAEKFRSAANFSAFLQKKKATAFRQWPFRAETETQALVFFVLTRSFLRFK